MDLLLTPVNIVRYWEFPFALRSLAKEPGRCLDVSSPRLFSFYVASHRRATLVRMLNPDVRDAELTRSLAKRLGRRALVVESLPVSAIEEERERYDSIWSISVIEHIPSDGDIEAMRLMFAALAPGGTLIVTVPVDRRAWDEYRRNDAYALGTEESPQGVFFQRWYDEDAIERRLLDPVRDGDVQLEWFGERVAGRFAEYEQDWIRRGRERIVDDPREIADWYEVFDRWSDMAGQGVCGIVVRKPK
jgi:SAM-dependent methyltransferase